MSNSVLTYSSSSPPPRKKWTDRRLKTFSFGKLNGDSSALSMVLDMLDLYSLNHCLLPETKRQTNKQTNDCQVGEDQLACPSRRRTHDFCSLSLQPSWIEQVEVTLDREDSMCLCFLMKSNGFASVYIARGYCISEERRFPSWHLYELHFLKVPEGQSKVCLHFH